MEIMWRRFRLRKPENETALLALLKTKDMSRKDLMLILTTLELASDTADGITAHEDNMNVEDAICILNDGQWWDYLRDDISAADKIMLELHTAIDVALTALREKQEHERCGNRLMLNGIEYRQYQCHSCGWTWLEDCDASDYPNYCPSCGAEMDGGGQGVVE